MSSSSFVNNPIKTIIDSTHKKIKNCDSNSSFSITDVGNSSSLADKTTLSSTSLVSGKGESLEMIDSSQPGLISCCLCGTPIPANLTNHHMCWPCLERNVDIAAPLRRPSYRRRSEIILEYCKKCCRYQQPPGEWIAVKNESPELLKMCLKRIKGLKHFNLCSANFISPETDSERLKVQLIIENKDIETKTMINNEQKASEIPCLRRSLTIDYIKRLRLCDECRRMEAKNYWRCVVQLRQHSDNKCTYNRVQKIILKQYSNHNEYNILDIKSTQSGCFDYYFAKEYHAKKFVDFLENLVPVRVITSSRFISHHPTSKVDRYKYTWSVEIAPISCDSLICLPMKLRQQFGHFAPICLVYRLSAGIHLMDPLTCQTVELNASNYFRSPFDVICDPKQLHEYIILDIELITINYNSLSSKNFPNSKKATIYGQHKLCDIWLVRSDQLGTSNQIILHARSHLGDVLAVGDTVLAYNLKDTNVNDIEFEKLKSEQIPDIVVVRKCTDDHEVESSDISNSSLEIKKSESKKQFTKTTDSIAIKEDNNDELLELTELLELCSNEDDDHIVFFTEKNSDISQKLILPNS